MQQSRSRTDHFSDQGPGNFAVVQRVMGQRHNSSTITLLMGQAEGNFCEARQTAIRADKRE